MRDALEPVHGTALGYGRHVRSGTTPCRACRDAQNRYKQALKITTGQVAGVMVPVGVLSELLHGARPASTLRQAFGQEVVDALRWRKASRNYVTEEAESA